MSDSLLTLQEVLDRHHAIACQHTSCGLLAVRDHDQRLWFYYEPYKAGYRVTGSTRNHPKYYK